MSTASVRAWTTMSMEASSRALESGGRVGDAKMFITAAHLDNPFEHRKLDAASMGASFDGGMLDGLSSEVGYRRAASVAGLGWSSELRRQGEDGSFSVRAVYAPGGMRAYARATNELSASGSRRLADWVTLNGSYWQSGDRSGTIGSSDGGGWSFGPSFSIPSIGTRLTLQGRSTSLDVSGDGGHFGSAETQASAILGVRRGMLFFDGSGSVGQISRSISALDNDLPALTGTSADLRGSFGASIVGGSVRFELGTQQYSGGASVMPQRTSVALRAEHIAIPVMERLRVYANVSRAFGILTR